MAENLFKIAEIGKRASEIAKGIGHDIEPINFMLDMETALKHEQNKGIDLDVLLRFDDGNFAHDVFGIHRHLNRETGELMDCFSPRCTR